MSKQHFTECWTGVAGIVCPRRLAHNAHSAMSVPSHLLNGEKGLEGQDAGTEAGQKSGYDEGRPLFFRTSLVVSEEGRQVWGAEGPSGCCP